MRSEDFRQRRLSQGRDNQYGKRSQEQYVTLFGLFTEGDDFLQQLRPHVVLWKGRQGGIRLGAFGELFLFVGIIGNVIFHLTISRARVWKIRGCPCCPQPYWVPPSPT